MLSIVPAEFLLSAAVVLFSFDLKTVLSMNALFMSVYHQVLAQDISYFPLPDMSLVAEHSEPEEMGRLLQLILGCAVRCEQQQGTVCLLSWI